MKHIFKKNQIIITTLAIMIAIAGYLNYSGRLLSEKTDTVSSKDSTVLLTDEGVSGDAYADTYSDIVSLDGDGTQEAAGDVLQVTDEADSGIQQAAADAGAVSEALPDGQTDPAKVGEAVLANAGTQDGILASAKLNREQIRAKSRESLMEIINSTDISEEQKENAVSVMTQMSVTAEKEAAAELLLESKGFADCVVSITDDTCDVVVGETDLTDTQRAQIEDVVKRKTEIAGENIIITPKSYAAEELGK